MHIRHNRETAFCQQIIDGKHFCENIIYHYPVYPYIFFCKYHARNLVWNWCGSIEYLSFGLEIFHFILTSFKFHIEISIPYHALTIGQSAHFLLQLLLCARRNPHLLRSFQHSNVPEDFCNSCPLTLLLV